nr:stalk domain-containing protein [Sedimentibacter sp.]
MKKIKVVTTYVLVLLMLLSSLTIFPGYAYSRENRDNMVEMFSFKTLEGYYFCAEDGGGSILTADRTEIGPWEKFQIVNLTNGYVAVKSYEGYYLGASDDEESLNLEETEIGKRQKFKLVELDNNKIALETYYDKYVCAEEGGGGKVVADRTKIGEWESFELIKNQESNIDGKCTLTAKADDKGVKFTWTKPRNTKNIIGYNLYRSTSPGKQSDTPVTDFFIEETSYTDKNIKADTKYYYIVRAVYKDKSLGPASNEVEVILKSNIILSAKAVDDGIYLSWNKPKYSPEIIGYNIYRATRSGRQSDTPITDFPIEGTSYTDKNIDNNQTYYYILKAVYKDKSLGEPTDEVSVKSNFGKTIVLQVGSRYMYVNDKKIEIDPGKGTEVVIKNGRTFLPIRALIENMGGEVEWDQSDRMVSLYLNKHKIYLWIGNKTARVDGTNKETDVEPYISDTNRTMLPLRFIIENFDCEVDWDGLTKKVTIKTK